MCRNLLQSLGEAGEIHPAWSSCESETESSGRVCRNLLRSLGEAGEIEPETDGILTEYNIDTAEFSDEVLCDADYLYLKNYITPHTPI